MFGKFLKFLIALVLLPLLAGEVWTLIDLIRTAVPVGQWREIWVISLCAGFAAWLLIFALLPKPMWLYVLGHEFTHALAAMLAGGKVSAFKVTSKGGHVMTDRVNWWIALSPYFVPIYALIWSALWLTVDFYYPLKGWTPVLFFGIGLFWCFHLTFTASMIHKGQTDLTGQGTLFAVIVILLFNLAIFLLLFSLLARDLRMSGHLFLHRTGQSYLFAWKEITHGAAWAYEQLLRNWK